MDFFSRYATDPVKEVTGVEVTIDGEKYTVARLGNRPYARALAKAIETNSAVLDKRDTDEDQAAADACSDAIMAKVIASTILLGWTGDQTYKGQPFPYSTANAEIVLAHKDFRAKVMAKAGEMEQYRAAYEETVGNV